MIAGVVLWVALAAIFPTVVVPAIQHAVVQQSGKPATPDAQPKDGPGTPAPAAPGGGDSSVSG